MGHLYHIKQLMFCFTTYTVLNVHIIITIKLFNKMFLSIYQHILNIECLLIFIFNTIWKKIVL